VPVNYECKNCGHSNSYGATYCEKCEADLKDAYMLVSCDRCGVALPDGTQPVGTCLKCQNPVYMCQNHKAKMVGEEIFCKEHESDCFIATAVFGTALDPQIDILRRFRDDWLMTNPLGRVFVFTYYEISPPIARKARHSSLLRRILRHTIVNPALSITRTIFGSSE